MLEYFTYKKFKKPKGEKNTKEESKVAEPDPSPQKAAETPSPAPETVVLDDSDQEFIERILSEAGDEAPPLPHRVSTPDLSWDSASESGEPTPLSEPTDSKGKTKEEPPKDVKKKNRFSSLLHRKKADTHLEPTVPITEKEAEHESEDLVKVLDKLNMSARDNKAISLSAETGELVRKFTQVIKDIMTGVPTAYQDLVGLMEDRDGVLARNYEKLPRSLQKLITSLPTKIMSSLAPELLAVAAEAQGLEKSEGKDDAKGAAKKLLNPTNMAQFLTKPGAIASMLKAIVNALKARFPAFIGTNAIWAVAMSILMFVLWYCHKRGREVRLEREKSVDPIDESDRIEELPDDPQLPAVTTGPSSSEVSPVTVEEPAK